MKEAWPLKQCMDADNLHRRLRKIIGQVQAVKRMGEENVPYWDVLSQLNAAKPVLHGQVMPEDHIFSHGGHTQPGGRHAGAQCGPYDGHSQFGAAAQVAAQAGLICANVFRKPGTDRAFGRGRVKRPFFFRQELSITAAKLV